MSRVDLIGVLLVDVSPVTVDNERYRPGQRERSPGFFVNFS